MMMMGLLSLFLDRKSMDYSACIYSFLQKNIGSFNMSITTIILRISLLPPPSPPKIRSNSNQDKTVEVSSHPTSSITTRTLQIRAQDSKIGVVEISEISSLKPLSPFS